jgi:hypothetical protein
MEKPEETDYKRTGIINVDVGSKLDWPRWPSVSGGVLVCMRSADLDLTMAETE